MPKYEAVMFSAFSVHWKHQNLYRYTRDDYIASEILAAPIFFELTTRQMPYIFKWNKFWWSAVKNSIKISTNPK